MKGNENKKKVYICNTVLHIEKETSMSSQQMSQHKEELFGEKLTLNF